METRKADCQCQRPFCTTPRCPQCRATVCATTVVTVTVEWDFLHSVNVLHATTTGTTVPVQDDQYGQTTTVLAPSNEFEEIVYVV